MFCFCFISHVTTSETKLKQNCFVSVLFQMSYLLLSMSAVWTEMVTRQDSFVLSRTSFQFATAQSQIYWAQLKTWRLETVLSCLQLSCPCRQCEQVITMSISAELYCSQKQNGTISIGSQCIISCYVLVKLSYIQGGPKTGLFSESNLHHNMTDNNV